MAIYPEDEHFIVNTFRLEYSFIIYQCYMYQVVMPDYIINYLAFSRNPSQNQRQLILLEVK